ncbi:unnamed protein product, partial [Citrullus colocynthis]
WQCATNRSPLIWSTVVHRTEIKRNYRSSLDFRGGEGIILLEEEGYCSLMVVRPNPVQE